SAAAAWLLADFAILSVAAAVTGRLPVAAAVPVAGLAGLVNARAWYGLTAVVARAPGAAPGNGLLAWRQRIRSVPVATVAAIAVVILAVRVVFLVGVPAVHATQGGPGTGTAAVGRVTDARQAAAAPRRPRWSRRPPVLVVPGFGSYCCSHGQALAQAMPGTLVQTFSYRGLDRAGNPLPYGPADSNLPLSVLGDRIAAQVRRLHAKTGEKGGRLAGSRGPPGRAAAPPPRP